MFKKLLMEVLVLFKIFKEKKLTHDKVKMKELEELLSNYLENVDEWDIINSCIIEHKETKIRLICDGSSSWYTGVVSHKLTGTMMALSPVVSKKAACVRDDLTSFIKAEAIDNICKVLKKEYCIVHIDEDKLNKTKETEAFEEFLKIYSIIGDMHVGKGNRAFIFSKHSDAILFKMRFC